MKLFCLPTVTWERHSTWNINTGNNKTINCLHPIHLPWHLHSGNYLHCVHLHSTTSDETYTCVNIPGRRQAVYPSFCTHVRFLSSSLLSVWHSRNVSGSSWLMPGVWKAGYVVSVSLSLCRSKNRQPLTVAGWRYTLARVVRTVWTLSAVGYFYIGL